MMQKKGSNLDFGKSVEDAVFSMSEGKAGFYISKYIAELGTGPGSQGLPEYVAIDSAFLRIGVRLSGYRAGSPQEYHRVIANAKTAFKMLADASLKDENFKHIFLSVKRYWFPKDVSQYLEELYESIFPSLRR